MNIRETYFTQKIYCNIYLRDSQFIETDLSNHRDCFGNVLIVHLIDPTTFKIQLIIKHQTFTIETSPIE